MKYANIELLQVVNYKMTESIAKTSDKKIEVATAIQKANVKTILIGRHGKPALSRKVWLSADGYAEWWKLYDLGGLAEGQTPPRKLLNAIAKTKYIVSSPLPRAHETALAAVGDRPIDIEEIFIEAPLPPPPLPTFIKFRPKIWGFISRCTWFVGLNYGQESHVEAKERAKNAASKLASLADEHGSVALFAHGWFNRMMRPYLLLLGYKCVEDGGDWHWSYRIYQKAD